MTISDFPVKGFVVVDAKGKPHHKRGDCGFYLTPVAAGKCAAWFNFRHESQGPFFALPALVFPSSPVDGSGEIKSCDHCGGVAKSENTITEGVVRCTVCRLSITRKHSPKSNDDGLSQAIAAWNMRIGRGLNVR